MTAALFLGGPRWIIGAGSLLAACGGVDPLVGTWVRSSYLDDIHNGATDGTTTLDLQPAGKLSIYFSTVFGSDEAPDTLKNCNVSSAGHGTWSTTVSGSIRMLKLRTNEVWGSASGCNHAPSNEPQHQAPPIAPITYIVDIEKDKLTLKSRLSASSLVYARKL